MAILSREPRFRCLLGVIISGLQIIQAGFGIVVIPAIAEGIQCTEGACQGSGNSEVFAPAVRGTIVGILYDSVVVAVNQLDNPLKTGP